MTNKAISKKTASIGLLLLLGALTAFDSIAIDMYLPAFEAMEKSLKLAPGVMPMSLSVFLIGLAIGQAVNGPLIDSLGRRKPLIAGIIIFGAASALVAFSVDIYTLMIGRFFQGIGGAAGLVIPRAIVSDIYKAGEAIRIYTLLIQIQSISPIAAPLLGGVLLKFWGWQSIFLILVFVAILALIATIPVIPETLPKERRSRLTLKNVLLNYWEILKNKQFMGFSLSAGLVMGTLFGYISASSFIFMGYFGLAPSVYSIIFAVNSVGMILAGQLNLYLTKRMSSNKNLAFGFLLHLIFMTMLLLAVVAGFDNLWTVGVLLFLATSSLCLIFGGITTETMYSVDNSHAGSASALLGVLQYAIGGIAGIVLGILHDATLQPIVWGMEVCSVLAAACWAVTSRHKQA